MDSSPGEAATAPGDTESAGSEAATPEVELDEGSSSVDSPGSADEDESSAGDETDADALATELTRESLSVPGPFPVLTIDSGLRDGPDCEGQTLFLPAASEALAAVVVVPGFNAPEESIQAWGPFLALASHGIATLTIGSNNLQDSANARADAVLDALKTMSRQALRSSCQPTGALAPAGSLGLRLW